MRSMNTAVLLLYILLVGRRPVILVYTAIAEKGLFFHDVSYEVQQYVSYQVQYHARPTCHERCEYSYTNHGACQGLKLLQSRGPDDFVVELTDSYGSCCCCCCDEAVVLLL